MAIRQTMARTTADSTLPKAKPASMFAKYSNIWGSPFLKICKKYYSTVVSRYQEMRRKIDRTTYHIFRQGVRAEAGAGATPAAKMPGDGRL